KKVALILIFAVAMAIVLSASPLTVSWLDGKVEQLSGSSWIPLNLGDKIDSASKVRLAAGASAEFTGGGRKISLTAPGVFVLDTLLKRGLASAKATSGALDMLGKLVDPKAQTTDVTAAGVRGAAIGDQSADSMTWESDTVDTDALMASARQLVRDGHFVEAADKFGQAAAAADGDRKDDALYGQAWALAAGGRTIESVKILRMMRPAGVWAGPRALLLGRLDIDSGAKDEAISVLQAALNGGTLAGNDIQMAKDMLGEAQSM
ncbi:MAG TPA: hypothetical protein VMC79_00395, partial [Rectinemataceae bacterium]|nr:hypothetical protein [Rectinemataceae bacterium]